MTASAPTDMKEKVKANASFYFNLWLKFGKSWGQVKQYETHVHQQRTSRDKSWSWIPAWQLKRDYPAIAVKVIEELRGKEGWWKKDTVLQDEEFDFVQAATK